MRSLPRRHGSRLSALLVFLVTIGALAGPAAAQLAPPPSAPAVRVERTIVPDENGVDLLITWTYDYVTFPDTVFAVIVTKDGLPFGSLPLRFDTDGVSRFAAQFSDLDISGVFTIQIVARNFLGDSAPSLPSEPFRLTPDSLLTAQPNAPSLNQPTVQGTTVSLSWVPNATGPRPTGYDIVAFVQATGQTLVIPLGDQTSYSVGDVPAGNFIVRIRAKNAVGVSDLSQQRLVVVGVLLGTGDLQATLTWNSGADVDLHVIEPNGAHVYYSSRTGVTARLDRDDTDGLGPENIFVDSGRGASGVYRIYIVHFGRAVPTTSTISLQINAGRPNERSAFITRVTSSANPGVGFNVADVDLVNGTITETSGTGPAIRVSTCLARTRRLQATRNSERDLPDYPLQLKN